MVIHLSMDSLLKGDVFNTSDIIIIILNIIIIFLVITLYLHINASDCRGQIITKSKTSRVKYILEKQNLPYMMVMV